MHTATGSFEVASWDEVTYEDRPEGTRLSRAKVTQRFEGGIAGEGAAEWLMSYRPDGTARFVGLQRVIGDVAGKSGSFVLEAIGDFNGELARWEAAVIPGSGTDELAGLNGRGSFQAPHGCHASFTIDYDLG